MNPADGEHISAEELAELLYGELAGERTATVHGHLAQCPQCAAELARWKAVRGELASWRLSDQRRPARLWRFARQAIAAALLVTAGFGIARIMTPAQSLDTNLLHQELQRQVAFAIQQYANQQQTRETAFEQSVGQALQQMEGRRVLAETALQHDVQTVAMQTQMAFGQLAERQGE